MYGIVRIIFWIIMFGIIVLIIRKFKTIKKKDIIFLILFTSLLCTLSSFCIIENYFIEFSTPEQAFKYIYFENVKLVIDGEKSTLIIGQEEKNKFNKLIIPKSPNGWKISRGIDTKLIRQIIRKDIVIELIQYKDSEDYYIMVLDVNDNISEITDCCNTNFSKLKSDELYSKFAIYSAYISVFNENYWIKVNGQIFNFGE